MRRYLECVFLATIELASMYLLKGGAIGEPWHHANNPLDLIWRGQRGRRPQSVRVALIEWLNLGAIGRGTTVGDPTLQQAVSGS